MPVPGFSSHDIACIKGFGVECGISGQGTDKLHTFAAQRFESGDDHLDLFPSHVATLPGVGVQAENGDARRGKGKPGLQISLQYLQGLPEQFRADRVRHRPQGQVGGCQRNPQARGGQHHYDLRRAGGRRQEFRMPGKGNAGVIDDGFLDRGGDHGVAAACEAGIYRGVQGVEHVAGVGGIELAGMAGRIHGHRIDLQGAGCMLPALIQGLLDNLDVNVQGKLCGSLA